MDQLTPEQHPKVWGSTQLEPWFPNSPERIGEVWFSAPEELPLLVKFLFTLDSLSVQVHPDDEYARTHENSRGKTEMWHILRADPGARIALGFKRGVTAEELRHPYHTARTACLQVYKARTVAWGAAWWWFAKASWTKIASLSARMSTVPEPTASRTRRACRSSVCR